jgi:hypothetical protein
MQPLDVKRFIKDNFGGARALHESLAHRADCPKLDTIYKWEARGTLPRDGLAMLLNELEDRVGAPVSLKSYVGDSTCLLAQEKRLSTGTPPSIFD